MKRTISINKLRHVSELTFEMPDVGVWLLTGSNGSGKSTLLSAMRRIDDKFAFSQEFPSIKVVNSSPSKGAGSKKSVAPIQVDSTFDASIKYTAGADEVTYTAKSSGKWVPTPRAQSKLLQKKKLGYASIIHMRADAKRLSRTSEEFWDNKITPLPQSICEAMNVIFGTSRFENLHKMHFTTSDKRVAYLLPLSGNSLQPVQPKSIAAADVVAEDSSQPVQLKSRKIKAGEKFATEKHFSLGELCVLKLLLALEDAPLESLILIDELELALHPKAQIELLAHLEKMSKRHRQTIIFSTHSTTLIRKVSPSNIYYLEKDESGSVSAKKGCFPTYILDGIGDHFSRFDLVFFVEDDCAQIILEQFIKLALGSVDEKEKIPSFCVIPIGGWDSVVRFLDRGRQLLSKGAKSFATLDLDAKHHIDSAKKKNVPLSDIIKRNSTMINYLPWTPEVGIVEYLKKDLKNFEIVLNNKLSLRSISFDQSYFASIIIENGGDSLCRDACKKALEYVVDSVCQETGKSASSAQELVVRIFADLFYANNEGVVKSLVNPCISCVEA